MRDLRGIIEAWRLRGSEPCVVATVVNVEGSAYRRPGARMLIHADGSTTGAVSGGCLEADIRLRATRLLSGGQATTVRYDTTPDDDIVFGVGGGCRGIVHVLLERVERDAPGSLPALLARAQDQRKSVRLATVIQSEGDSAPAVGARLAGIEGEEATGNVEWPDLAVFLEREMRQSQPDAPPRIVEWRSDGRSARAFVEILPPPIPLVLFGGGVDAAPVAAFARGLGWHVTVYDHRAAYVTEARFPTADERVCAPPEECDTRLSLGEETLAIVMTHSYHHDRELLRRLLTKPLRYLAVLGPRSRTRQIVEEIQQDTLLSEEAIRVLRSPAGLDIGAESPEEIALSIVAEMQATLTARCGGMLADRPGPIHVPQHPAAKPGAVLVSARS